VAFIITYPLINGDYFYVEGEYRLYKSFMINFIETLRQGVLPTWNEYFGSGHPALLFGHYPITQNTIFFMLFGYSDLTYNISRFFALSILLLSSAYAFRILKVGFLLSLAGALIYFALGFTAKYIMADTIGNILVVYPLVVVLLLSAVRDRSILTIAAFWLLYIFWFTGGHVTHFYMHLLMLSMVFWAAVFYLVEEPLKAASLKRSFFLYLILLIVPLVAVAYQYYFAYDLVLSSNRLREGLIVSPFDPEVWLELLSSFRSSSYIRLALFTAPVYLALWKVRRLATLIVIPQKAAVAILLAPAIALLILIFSGTQFGYGLGIFEDYIPLLNAFDFRIALVLYLSYAAFFQFRSQTDVEISFIDIICFMLCVSLLSTYLYSPGNIDGYDYKLYMELGTIVRIVFVFGVLSSIRLYRGDKTIKVLVVSLVCLYLIRSHFMIPMLRIAGVLWYTVRESTIYGAFFAILFIFGFRDFFTRLSDFRSDVIVRYISTSFVALFIILLVRDVTDKFYEGDANRYLFPSSLERAGMPKEKQKILEDKELNKINSDIVRLAKERRGFFRTYTPQSTRSYKSGTLQDKGVFESVLYESSIPMSYVDFYKYTILKKEPPRVSLRSALPLYLFAKHVHDGFGLPPGSIKYQELYPFSPDDIEYMRKNDMEFLWDLMGVRFLVLELAQTRFVNSINNSNEYQLQGKYPALGLYLVERKTTAPYSRFALLELEEGEDPGELIKRLNSGEVETLRGLFSRLEFLGDDIGGAKNKKSLLTLKRKFEVNLASPALLVNLESWNHSLALKVNGEEEELHRAFQIFRAVSLKAGVNAIELTYRLKYFKALFALSIIAIGACFITLAVLIGKRRKNGKFK
jgi:hypothetical protein